MRYKVYNYDNYDVLTGYEHEGNTLIQTYVHKDDTGFYPNLTVERLNDMIVMIYATFSDGTMRAFDIVHIFDIHHRYDALRILAKKLYDAYTALDWEQIIEPWTDSFIGGMDFVALITNN